MERPDVGCDGLVGNESGYNGKPDTSWLFGNRLTA